MPFETDMPARYLPDGSRADLTALAQMGYEMRDGLGNYWDWRAKAWVPLVSEPPRRPV